jgi:hypothetical protein
VTLCIEAYLESRRVGLEEAHGIFTPAVDRDGYDPQSLAVPLFVHAVHPGEREAAGATP